MLALQSLVRIRCLFSVVKFLSAPPSDLNYIKKLKSGRFFD